MRSWGEREQEEGRWMEETRKRDLVSELVHAVKEMMLWGAGIDDERLHYIECQVNRNDIELVDKLLEEVGKEFEL